MRAVCASRLRPTRLARSRALIAIAACLASAAFSAAATTSYSRFFTGDTMRVDYVHGGGPHGERLAFDRVVRDGPWPGSRTRLIDGLGFGEYVFEVADRASGRLVYSRGFGSIYGEWITTPEFRSADRTFQESLRFPWPKAAVRITLKRRDEQNALQPFWSLEIDPGSAKVNPATTAAGEVWTLFENGPPSSKVDLLLMSDGYTAAQLPQFHADAARLTGVLFGYEPFKSRRSDFNVRAVDLPAERSTLNTEYNIFGLPRYVLTFNNRLVRAAAAAAPYDLLEILVNNHQYGGGGIYNLQSTVAVGSERAEYVFVHELAHNLAGLADEYVGNVT